MGTVLPAPGATAPVFLPGLNGIRAVASVAVLVSHSVESFPRFGLTHWDHLLTTGAFPNEGWGLGNFAVTIFFTLSGFLITYLLLLEHDRYGTD